MCHIVVLAPSIQRDTGYPPVRFDPYISHPKNQPLPYLLYEHSLGDKSKWPLKFDQIAESKALQLWHNQNNDGTDIQPHLLFPGDTAFWGGVKRDGIVVACSGFQPWFDKMVSGMIADTIKALCYDAWMTSKIKEGNAPFLT